jgi:7-carboxy-7-deazaguanine synthase
MSAAPTVTSTRTIPAHTDAQVVPVQEIFSSIQGEGPYVGVRQLFVRFAHCHLKCAYCDTPMVSDSGQAAWYPSPQALTPQWIENPLTPEALMVCLAPMLAASPHHSVSFTGGEPLLYHRLLKALMPQVRPLAKTYLETSGTQPDFLSQVIDATDIVAMDIKLPSSTGFDLPLADHQAFYALCHDHPRVETFIKLVVNEKTTLAELDAVRAIVTDANTPIVIQPETWLVAPPQTKQPHAKPTLKISPAKLIQLQDTLLQWFPDVRVVPQTHKMLAVL